MICLIDTQETPIISYLERFVRARRGYKGITARVIMILGIKVLRLTIEATPAMHKKAVQFRIKYAADRLRAEHVRKVMFSKNFPYRELMLREGFDEIEEGFPTEILIGKIVSAFSGSDKVAAFYADRLTGSVEQTFCEMCRDFRYVMAAVEADGGRLITSLGRRLGISVIGQPTEKQLSKADVAVFFSPPRSITVLPDKCIAIPVNDACLVGVICRQAVVGATVGLKRGKIPDFPEEFSYEPFIAAAIEAGTLRREDVSLSEIKMADMYL